MGYNRPMKKSPLFLLLILGISVTLACKRVTGLGRELTPGPNDAVLSGRALLDSNDNGQVDAHDQPLAGATFHAPGYSAQTDELGIAVIIIPDAATLSTTVSMAPPPGGYTLLGPAQATLAGRQQPNADFLFAPPASQPAGPLPAGQAKAGGKERDLTYCTTPDGLNLKMDVSYPADLSTARPAIVYVHGGAWSSGSKEEGAGTRFAPALLEAGYIFISIDYRLAPQYQFPAHIQDVKCAIRHLRAYASRYNLDPQRIGALGSSAGGHLVGLLGLSDRDAGWDVGPYTDFSSRVQAVVDLFGPADLTQMSGGLERAAEVFGIQGPDDPALRAYSPVTYISAGDPPFLIIQGSEDTTVLPSQSQMLYKRLKAAGLSAELVMVKNAGHGFQQSGGSLQPSMDELVQIMLNFLNQSLK